MDPGTLVGIEVTLPVPYGPPVDQWQPLVLEGGIQVMKGAVHLVEENGKTNDLLPSTAWTWSRIPNAAHLSANWITTESRPVTPPLQKVLNQFEVKFPFQKAIEEELLPEVRDLNERQSELSLLTLSLLDQHEELARALQSKHPKTIQASILGLRQWLPRHPGNQALLQTDLSNVFPPNDVAPLIRLLWGFHEQDAHNPTTSKELVEWLSHNEAAVRELAFQNVTRLTNKKNSNYSPYATGRPFQMGVTYWEEHLKKEGALLKNEKVK